MRNNYASVRWSGLRKSAAEMLRFIGIVVSRSKLSALSDLIQITIMYFMEMLANRMGTRAVSPRIASRRLIAFSERQMRVELPK